MVRKKTSWRRAILALMLLTALVLPLTGGSAQAVSPLPILCSASGTIFWTDLGGSIAWTLSGRGSCQGDQEGTYFLDFTGGGTSDSAGLCDMSGLVTNLNINVVGTLTNAATLAVKGINHDWVAPISTYPIVTPFLIQKGGNGDLIGAGAFFNHIFAQCMNSPVARFDFLFTT